ncbi:MAG: DUF6597 domain-containing transcriptional factor [Acidimicrobiales bacterium]
MSRAWFAPRHPRSDLAPALACAWTARPSGRHRLVPDACLDLVCLLDGRLGTSATGLATGDEARDETDAEGVRLLLCGPERRAWSFEVPPGTVAVGVRFRPGWAALAFGIDVSTLLDRRVPLGRLVGHQVADRIAARLARPGDLDERASRLEAEVAPFVTSPDPRERAFVDTAIELLVRSPRPGQQHLAGELGLTPRQVHRRLQRTFGHGAAVLGRQLRFQRFLAVYERHHATGAPASLATLATAAGYADQAHLSRDCRALTGTTVRRFVDEWFPTFPDMSDPFKTSEPFVGTMGA